MTCSCFKPQSHPGGSDGDGKHDDGDCDGKCEGVDSDYEQDGNQTTSFIRCHLFLPTCLLWIWDLLQIQVLAQRKSKLNHGWSSLSLVSLSLVGDWHWIRKANSRKWIRETIIQKENHYLNHWDFWKRLAFQRQVFTLPEAFYPVILPPPVS